MENYEEESLEAEKEVYEVAANLLLNKKMDREQVIQHLVDQGTDVGTARIVVDQIATEISKSKQVRANKDMLYGGLWCAGGIIATAADIGYIFWGAIVFGALQFFKGVAKL